MHVFANEKHMRNEKNPGRLGYIGDYTTPLDRDFNKPLLSIRIPNKQAV